MTVLDYKTRKQSAQSEMKNYITCYFLEQNQSVELNTFSMNSELYYVIL